MDPAGPSWGPSEVEAGRGRQCGHPTSGSGAMCPPGVGASGSDRMQTPFSAWADDARISRRGGDGSDSRGAARSSTSPDSRSSADLDLDMLDGPGNPYIGSSGTEGLGVGAASGRLSTGLDAVHIADDAMELDEDPPNGGTSSGRAGSLAGDEGDGEPLVIERKVDVGAPLVGKTIADFNPFERFRIQRSK